MNRLIAPVEKPAYTQRGAMLLEALIAILLFAIGILGLVGLLGSSIRVTNDARYRFEAANLANAMIAEMWTNTSGADQLLTDYGSPGTKLTPWQTKAEQLLPSADKHPIKVDLSDGASAESKTVAVTVFWQLPGETELHQQMMTAQIGKNRDATWP